MKIVVSMMIGLLINAFLISICEVNKIEFYVEYLPMLLALVFAIYAIYIKNEIIKSEPQFSAALNSYDGIEIALKKMEVAESISIHLAKKLLRISHACQILIGWCMAFPIVLFVKFVIFK